MPISTWEPSELDKQTQIAQQALARIAELEADLLTAVRYGEAQNQALKGCAAEQAATVANRDELIRMVVSLKAALVERERL